MAYYAPTDEALKKLEHTEKTGEPLDSDDRLEFKLGREYNWAIRNEGVKGFEPNYFFCYRNGSAYYNCLDTRVKLTRRPKGGISETMLVRNDELNDHDRAEFEKRLLKLTERELLPEDDEEIATTTEQDEEAKRLEEIAKAQKVIFGDDTEDESSASSSGSSDDSDDEGKASGEEKVEKKKAKSSSGESSSSGSSSDADE